MRACIWLHVGYDGGMFVRLRAVTSSWKIVLIFPELHQQFIKHATFTEGGGGFRRVQWKWLAEVREEGVSAFQISIGAVSVAQRGEGLSEISLVNSSF